MNSKKVSVNPTETFAIANFLKKHIENFSNYRPAVYLEAYPAGYKTNSPSRRLPTERQITYAKEYLGSQPSDESLHSNPGERL